MGSGQWGWAGRGPLHRHRGSGDEAIPVAEQLQRGCPPRPRLPRTEGSPSARPFRFFAPFCLYCPYRVACRSCGSRPQLQSREAFRNSGRVFSRRHVKRPVFRQPPHLAPAWPLPTTDHPRNPCSCRDRLPPFGGPAGSVQAGTRRYGTWRLRALRRSVPLKSMPPCSWMRPKGWRMTTPEPCYSGSKPSHDQGWHHHLQLIT